MSYIRRRLEPEILRTARAFSAILLTGPRRSGKTTLLKRLFPKAAYVLLEEPDVVVRVRADPRAFLDGLELPAILDEIQAGPELFAYVRARIDAEPAKKGRWILTGSQESSLMRGVSESMAGRAAILSLWPFSCQESPAVSPFLGGYPEVLARPTHADLWFRSYLQTYLERDVRAITDVRDLVIFRRFIGLVASRTGQLVHHADLAAPLGVSIPTITRWLGILETTAQLLVVPPYFENFGKRIVKSPKLFVADAGLACHLLGLETADELERSPFLGAVFEGFVGAEIMKAQANAGRRHQLYHLRDAQGLEVDFVVPTGAGRLALVEAKASRTLSPGDAGPLLRLSKAIERYDVTRYVVHRRAKGDLEMSALAPGVHAVTVPELVAALVPPRVK